MPRPPVRKVVKAPTWLCANKPWCLEERPHLGKVDDEILLVPECHGRPMVLGEAARIITTTYVDWHCPDCKHTWDLPEEMVSGHCPKCGPITEPPVHANCRSTLQREGTGPRFPYGPSDGTTAP